MASKIFRNIWKKTKYYGQTNRNMHLIQNWNKNNVTEMSENNVHFGDFISSNQGEWGH